MCHVLCVFPLCDSLPRPDVFQLFISPHVTCLSLPPSLPCVFRLRSGFLELFCCKQLPACSVNNVVESSDSESKSLMLQDRIPQLKDAVVL